MSVHSDYMKEKEAYQEPLFTIKNGKGYFVVDGKEVSVKKWQSQNPKPIYIKPVPDNPDKGHVA